jgi:hypothetical protein
VSRLVGSEMCIRDRTKLVSRKAPFLHPYRKFT